MTFSVEAALKGIRTAVGPKGVVDDAQEIERYLTETRGMYRGCTALVVRPSSTAEVAEVVKGYARRPVRVEGHTDSVASDDYNQKLSERRAEAVRAWLAAKGIEPSRLQTRGFGESKPVADNATPEGRQKNRRVEVIIEKGT